MSLAAGSAASQPPAVPARRPAGRGRLRARAGCLLVPFLLRTGFTGWHLAVVRLHG